MKKLTKLLSAVLVLVLLFQLAPMFGATEADDPLAGQDDITYCEFCGVAEGQAHLEGCEYYEEDTPDCTCGAYYFTNQVHLDTCYYYEPVCCCDYAETGVHAAYCDLYEGPVCTCDYDVTGIHADTCDFYQAPGEELTCTCGTTDDFHFYGCAFYEEPEMGVYDTDPVQAFVDAVNKLPYDEIMAWYQYRNSYSASTYNETDQVNASNVIKALYNSLKSNMGWNFSYDVYAHYDAFAYNNEASWVFSTLENVLQSTVNAYNAAVASVGSENLATAVSVIDSTAYTKYQNLASAWSYTNHGINPDAMITPEIEVHLFDYGNLINTSHLDGVHFSSGTDFIYTDSGTSSLRNELDSIARINNTYNDYKGNIASCGDIEQRYAIPNDLSNGYPFIAEWFQLFTWPVISNYYDFIDYSDEGWGFWNFEYVGAYTVPSGEVDRGPYRFVKKSPHHASYHGQLWEYLFDKEDIDVESAISTSTHYDVKHYDVDTLQLFEKDDRGYYVYDSRTNAATYSIAANGTSSLVSQNYALRSSTVGRNASSQGAFLPFNSAHFGSISSLPNVTMLQNANGSRAYPYYYDSDWQSSWRLQSYALPLGMAGLSYPTEFADLDASSDIDAWNWGVGYDGKYYFGNYDWADWSGFDVDMEIAKGVQRTVADVYEVPGDVPNLYALNPMDTNTTDANFPANSENEAANLAFGMSMEFSFQMPKNGKVNGEDMIYEFIGDDDLVVYVDGKCVLNLMGEHEAIRGTVNFATGAVNIYEEGSYTVDSAARGDFPSNNNAAYTANIGTIYNYDLSPSLQTVFGSDYSKFMEAGSTHNVKIFYLERSGGTANCTMKFNIPVVDLHGDLTVEKKVTGTGEPEGQKYTFKLMDVESNAPITNTSYTLADGTTGSTNASGEFTLEGGQVAHFTTLPVGHQVTVEEVLASDEDRFTVSNTHGTGSITNPITIASTATKVVFNNDWDVSYGTLNVTKSVTGTGYTGDEYYTFVLKDQDGTPVQSAKYTVNGSEKATGTTGEFKLKKDETATFTELRTGTSRSYTVTEDLGDYENSVTTSYTVGIADPVTATTTGVLTLESETSVVFTNTWSIQYASLTISQGTFSQWDHSITDDSEKQSIIYNISGDGVDLDVVLTGDDSITVNGLIVGQEYTVSVKGDWAWRYNKPDNRGVTIDADSTKNTAQFSFTRLSTKTKWLSGDNFIANLFKAVTQS